MKGGQKMLNVAVLGYDYWGPNLVRNFSSIGVNVKYVADLNEKCLANAKSLYPAVNITTNVNDVFKVERWLEV